MINVSLECRKLMQSNTAFQEHVTITLADSTVLTIPQSDLIIQNNGITSGAGANAFPIGQASARTIRLEIANFDDKYSKYDFYGARIGLVVKYPLSNGTENFNYGYYTVITPETRGTTIKITAVDDMYKADKPYTTNISFPTTLLAIYNDACQTLGLTVQTASFANSSFVVDKKPENASFRQVLGGIAMFAGGNIYINREGRVEIKTYVSTQIDAWLHYDGGVFKPWETAGVLNGGSFNPWNTGDVADGDTFANMLNGIHVLYAWISPPNVDTDDIVITGIRAETGADTSVLEGDEGYVLNVENPLIEGKEAAALGLIGDIVIGLKFRQFSGDYIGDPTIEFMDPCIVVDRKGNTYGSFVTDTDYSFRGKTGISNSAEPKIRTGISYSNDTKTMQKTRALMDTRLSAYDAGIQMLTQLMNQSVGMYMTREIDANGSVIFYTHDQPTLEQSTIIRKVTANGITQSVDGGQTWTSGIDASGNAVLNILAAEGINAGWMNTGALTVRKTISGTEKIVLSIDCDTGILQWDATNSSMTADGTLSCSNANISGVITAGNGSQIGEMKAQVNSNVPCFYSGDRVNYNVDEEGICIESNGNFGASGNSAFWSRTGLQGDNQIHMFEWTNAAPSSGSGDSSFHLRTSHGTTTSNQTVTFNVDSLTGNITSTGNAKFSGNIQSGNRTNFNGRNKSGFMVESYGAMGGGGGTAYGTSANWWEMDASGNIKCAGELVSEKRINASSIQGYVSIGQGHSNTLTNNAICVYTGSEKFTLKWNSNATFARSGQEMVDGILMTCTGFTNINAGDSGSSSGHAIDVVKQYEGNPGVLKFYVTWDGYVYAVTTNHTSDERYKDVKGSYDYKDLFMSINPVEFTWKNSFVQDNAVRHLGVGAQTLKAQLKKYNCENLGLVSYDDKNDMYAVNYTELMMLSLPIVQEHERKIIELERKIDELQKRCAC